MGIFLVVEIEKLHHTEILVHVVLGYFMMSKDLYYFSSMDSARFADARRCQFIKILQHESGRYAALVEIDPPVVGQDFGIGAEMSEVLLLPRHATVDIRDIQQYPCFVYICRGLSDSSFTGNSIPTNQIEIIGWGEIYRTADDAIMYNFN